jgi:glycosyltransferase involved in cell wall biosynthesis
MREAIDSALAQTYQNIEIIVVNDGSTDNTETIALSYGNKIRYLSKENGGVASALNIGIKNMKGSYFSWLSHDDIYFPHKIERQIAALRELNDKNTMLFSNWIAVNTKSKEITRTFFEGHGNVKLLNPLFCVLFGLIHGSTVLIARELFSLFGVFDEKLAVTQDYDFWFRISSKSSIKFLPDYLVKVRIHAEQKTRSDARSNADSNAFWISMIKKLSPKDILSFEKSELLFFIKIRRFLKRSHYYEALNITEKIMEERINKWTILLILFFDDLKSTIYKLLFRPLLKCILGRSFVKRIIDPRNL